ncbi:WecB/TagA/CpsF family glycosyltransferase [Thiohalobacter thiocyanaticus]|uniref:Glycosyltransferase n=1 Tax=Thiohalobacter thiocyanaticus TaxID=585455 RepID=A0A426QIR1_9GAMM|nr:WecB/TagA/CpsF family glycosyltransferase [Thiohalobacter thiocyanaticus]RRQ21643.1 glycosyltransferase [Thiohalobacter thiocyanaticus]
MNDTSLDHVASSRRGDRVAGTFVDAADWSDLLAKIHLWALNRESRSVCLCNVHSAVTARENSGLAEALDSSDMVLPDGAPIAWTLRHKGFPGQTRIAGPDLMLKLCTELEHTGIGVFLFGSTDVTLQKLRAQLLKRFPDLEIRGILSPEFGNWSMALENNYIEEINKSGAGVIFVGLGCPRQEIWMSHRKSDIRGVMLGVGAAFDFHAETIKRAPKWLQKFGLEWLHRLLSEPQRLWKRYLITNTKFIALTGRELMTRNQRRHKQA